jgi:cysteinyl-tRNA synthetase
MIALIERLLAKGVAYKGDDGSVYFALAKFPGYGKLSRLDQRQIKVGARVSSDEYAKDDPSDFALWKKADAEDETVGAAWDAPFGRGRPGWHLECSAMSLDEIGRRFGIATLDIHCGGIDLIFPHHEDEIAQSEGATGQPFARYWVHGEFLNVRGTKMSKRFGNFLTARDLREQGIDAAAVRLLFWQAHYRQPIDFNDEALAAAATGVKRLGVFHGRLRELASGNASKANAAVEPLASRFETDFAAALDDDLDAPRAVSLLFDFATDANRELDRAPSAPAAQRALAAMDGAMAVLDVLPTPKTADEALSQWVGERLAQREKARKAKDFAAADRIRQELKARGVEIEDSPAGTKWRLL